MVGRKYGPLLTWIKQTHISGRRHPNLSQHIFQLQHRAFEALLPLCKEHDGLQLLQDVPTGLVDGCEDDEALLFGQALDTGKDLSGGRRVELSFLRISIAPIDLERDSLPHLLARPG